MTGDKPLILLNLYKKGLAPRETYILVGQKTSSKHQEVLTRNYILKSKNKKGRDHRQKKLDVSYPNSTSHPLDSYHPTPVEATWYKLVSLYSPGYSKDLHSEVLASLGNKYRDSFLQNHGGGEEVKRGTHFLTPAVRRQR